MRTTRTVSMIGAAACATLMLAVHPAAASRGPTVHVKTDLTSTGVDDDASGTGKLQVKGGSDGQLEVKVKKLARAAMYDVVVNGVRVGSIVTNRGGNGSIRFRSRPRSEKDLLLGFDPRGATVEIRDDNGVDVLDMEMPEGVPGDPGDIVCCIPDDGGAECEDRTPDECTAAGGTASTATSCLPNPCADAAPEIDVTCCTPDDSGPECEDRSAAECAAEQGVVVEATSCTPNPCAPTPPAAETTQCCLPDDAGFECDDRTPADCAAAGGTDMGPGTCTPDPCAGLIPAP